MNPEQVSVHMDVAQNLQNIDQLLHLIKTMFKYRIKSANHKIRKTEDLNEKWN